MYCSECNGWVECGKDVTSVKCGSCSNIIYNLPKQESSRELNKNQYFLVVANNGFLLLTKFKPEAKIVSEWKGIIFSGIVNRANHSIVYEMNGNEYVEKLKNIPVSQSYHRNLCFDFQTLEHSGHIKKVSIQNNLRSKYRKPHTP